MPKQPQDHRSKDPKVEPFTFVGADGSTYSLPLISSARDKLSGGEYEDAVMGGELGMLAYMVKTLRASGADPDALAQLRALPQSSYMDVVRAWGEHGDGDGASLGE